MTTKRCIDCHKEKPIADFCRYRYRNSATLADGSVSVYKGWRYQSVCRPCGVKRTSGWVQANRERYQAYQRAYNRARRLTRK